MAGVLGCSIARVCHRACPPGSGEGGAGPCEAQGWSVLLVTLGGSELPPSFPNVEREWGQGEGGQEETSSWAFNSWCRETLLRVAGHAEPARHLPSHLFWALALDTDAAPGGPGRATHLGRSGGHDVTGSASRGSLWGRCPGLSLGRGASVFPPRSQARRTFGADAVGRLRCRHAPPSCPVPPTVSLLFSQVGPPVPTAPSPCLPWGLPTPRPVPLSGVFPSGGGAARGCTGPPACPSLRPSEGLLLGGLGW